MPLEYGTAAEAKRLVARSNALSKLTEALRKKANLIQELNELDGKIQKLEKEAKELDGDGVQPRSIEEPPSGEQERNRELADANPGSGTVSFLQGRNPPLDPNETLADVYVRLGLIGRVDWADKCILWVNDSNYQAFRDLPRPVQKALADEISKCLGNGSEENLSMRMGDLGSLDGKKGICHERVCHFTEEAIIADRRKACSWCFNSEIICARIILRGDDYEFCLFPVMEPEETTLDWKTARVWMP